jgi:hypothetical protein
MSSQYPHLPPYAIDKIKGYQMKLFDNFYQKIRKSKGYIQNKNEENISNMSKEQL